MYNTACTTQATPYWCMLHTHTRTHTFPMHNVIMLYLCSHTWSNTKMYCDPIHGHPSQHMKKWGYITECVCRACMRADQWLSMNGWPSMARQFQDSCITQKSSKRWYTLGQTFIILSYHTGVHKLHLFLLCNTMTAFNAYSCTCVAQVLLSHY